MSRAISSLAPEIFPGVDVELEPSAFEFPHSLRSCIPWRIAPNIVTHGQHE